MKKIGIIGGMSPKSTVLYYAGICDGVNKRVGKNHCPPLCLEQVDFEEIREYQRNKDWEKAAELLGDLAETLFCVNYCDFLVIATNTMHKVIPDMEKYFEEAYSMELPPLLHIGEAIMQRLAKDGIKKIGMLGTSATCMENFIKQKIEIAGIEIITLQAQGDLDTVESIIFDELSVEGKELSSASKEKLHKYARELKEQGVEAIALCCTELCLAFEDFTDLPIYDSTQIHIDAIVDHCLED